MKKLLVLITVAASTFIPAAFAEDGCKCEMMKKPAPAAVQPSKPEDQQADLKELVAIMNSNVGPKKIEAMAAILTRLVTESNSGDSGLKSSSNGEKQPAEAHHH